MPRRLILPGVVSALLPVLAGRWMNARKVGGQQPVELGFDVRDVKVLLSSEPHPDHAGGLGVLQQASGAEIWSSGPNADSIESGGDDAEEAELHSGATH